MEEELTLLKKDETPDIPLPEESVEGEDLLKDLSKHISFGEKETKKKED